MEKCTMPYIKKDKRLRYDIQLEILADLINELPEEEKAGVVNYVVTRIIHRVFKPPKYNTYNSAIGVLECIKQELYRRIIVPYEDIKIKENGDVN
jgi:predicted type IV restriction endonuclease